MFLALIWLLSSEISIDYRFGSYSRSSQAVVAQSILTVGTVAKQRPAIAKLYMPMARA